MLSKIYLFSFANKTLQKGTLVNWLFKDMTPKSKVNPIS